MADKQEIKQEVRQLLVPIIVSTLIVGGYALVVKLLVLKGK